MVIDRIRQIIDYKNISTRKFCNEIGVANGFLDKVKDVGSEKLLKILNTYPEISPEWLLTGNGEMLKSEKSEMPDCSQCEKLQRMEMELERERCINNKLCGYEPGKKSAV